MHAGDKLADRYELIEQIGIGGMGEVWRAKQIALGRIVAIKVLHPLYRVSSPDLEQRFQREAELVAKVDHRNVIDVIDFGMTTKGDQFLVMPFLSGETFEERLRRAPKPDLKEIVSIARSVLGGLAAIHDAGIVHRDLKPANVFLARDADGIVPKLLDFGISREEEQKGVEGTALTQDGTMMGTPHYMAPEQFESARTVDHRADLFSIGAMLYEALSGRPPYQGTDPFAVYRKILESDPPPLAELRPELPEPIRALVHRAIAKKPDERFASAREMRQAIDGLIATGDFEGLAAADFPTLDQKKVHGEISTAPTAMAESNPGQPSSTGDLSASDPTPHLPATPKKSNRGLYVGIGLLAILTAGVAGVAIYTKSPEPGPVANPPDPVEPMELADDAATESAELPWVRLGASERVTSLAIRWARMPEADRALPIRFVSSEGEWAAVMEEASDEDAARLATAFAGTPTPSRAFDDVLTPALMQTTVRLNVHERAELESTTTHVIPHDTIVVAIHGALDAGTSSADGEGALTYFVTSLDDGGWALSRFLRPSSECLPIPATLVRENAIGAHALRRTFTAARTTIQVDGARRPVWMLMGRDAPGTKSLIGFYEPGRRCRPGDRIGRRVIDGVIDEVFLSETGDGDSLLVASWHPDEHSPADGMREWAAWKIDGGNALWDDSLPSGPFLDDAHIAAVSGTRDRILRDRNGYVLTVREPGTARRWFTFEEGEIVEAAGPTRR